MAILRKILAAFVSVSLAAGPAGAQANAVTRIGVAGAVQGKVLAYPPGEKPVGRILTSGQPLYLNEKIETDAKSRLQIMLADETVFTVGPNSAMVLDKFVYDPDSSTGKVSASILKGIFRFVTGKIGHENPSSMDVKFPVGTMGIRGTIVVGSVDAFGVHCILMGPGPQNNANDRVGSFTLSNNAGSVNVNRPGFGSNIGLSGPPSPPAFVPANLLGAVLGTLAPGAKESQPDQSQGGGQQQSNSNQTQGGGQQQGENGGSASDQAGQTTAGASGDLSNTESAGQTGGNADGASSAANQDVADPSIIAAGASTWEDVRSIPSGSGIYQGQGAFNLTQCSGGACQSPSGQMTFVLNVDFANNTIGGSGANGAPSFIAVNASDPGTSTSISDSINIGQEDYGAQSGPAVLYQQSPSGNLTALFSLKNADGLAAAFASAFASYDDGRTKGTGLVNADFNGDRGDVEQNLINALPASTWDEIRAIPNGTGRYSGSDAFNLTQCAGGACVSPSGSFGFTLNVDFRNNTFGGDCNGGCVASTAYVQATDGGTGTSISDSLTVPQQSFQSLSGSAVISQTSNSGNFKMRYTLRNAGDFAAGLADALATYDDGSTKGAGQTIAGLTDTSNEILNGQVSTWDQVRNVPLGTGQYQGFSGFNLTQCNGGACQSPSGSFGFLLNIDFPSQTIGGDCNGTCVASQANVSASDPGTNTSISDSLLVPAQSFSMMSGNATLHQVSNSGNLTVDFTLKNANGLAAGLADALASYDDHSTQGSGEATGALTQTSGNQPPPAPAFTQASWDDVRSVQTGTGRYQGFGAFNLTQCGGGACQSPSGSMNFTLNVDFANQTVGGDCGGRCVASGLSVEASDPGTSTSISDSLTVPAQSFSALTGNASVAAQSDSGRLGAAFNLQNANGVSAALVDVAANYSDGTNSGSGEATAGVMDTTNEILAGPSTWDQVRAIPSGTGVYQGNAPFTLTQCAGGACAGPTGSFSYLLNVDFSNKLIGGDCGGGCVASQASVSASDPGTRTSISDSLTVPAQSYSGLTGNAVVSQTSNSNNFSVQFSLRNSPGIAAALADVAATFNDGSTIGSGSDTASKTSPQLVFAGPTTWDQLRSIPSGTGSWSGADLFNLSACNGGACAAPSGTMNFNVAVDFGHQTIGGGLSGINVSATDANIPGGISDSIAIPSSSFAALAGSVVTAYSSASGHLNANFSVANAPGLIGHVGTVQANYNDGVNAGAGTASGSLVINPPAK